MDKHDHVDPDELTYRKLKHIILEANTPLVDDAITTGEIIQTAVNEHDLHPMKAETALAKMAEDGHIRESSENRWVITGAVDRDTIY